MWRPILRIILQLVLAGPVLAISPLAIILALTTLTSLGELKLHQAGVALTYVLSGLALPFLLLSILLTTRALRRSPWKMIATVGLVSGVIGSLMWVIGTGGAAQPGQAPIDMSALFMFGGPMIVAGWNLWRAWRPEAPAAVTSHP